MSYWFHPAAEAEYLEILAYYESKRAGLGAGYLIEFETAMEAVCATPQRYPIEREPAVRRKRMNRFPFTILFRERAGAIQVLAVAHNRRRPS